MGLCPKPPEPTLAGAAAPRPRFFIVLIYFRPAAQGTYVSHLLLNDFNFEEIIILLPHIHR